MALRLVLILGLLLQTFLGGFGAPCLLAEGGQATCCPAPSAARVAPMTCCGQAGRCCCTESTREPVAPKPAPTTRSEAQWLFVQPPVVTAAPIPTDDLEALRLARALHGGEAWTRGGGRDSRPVLCIWLT